MNLLDLLSIQIVHSSKKYVQLCLEIDERHKQPYGIVHGGINGILIETACSLGANHHLDEQSYAVGIDLQVNHLSSVSTGRLLAIATPDRIGKTIQVWQAKIYTDVEETIAVGRCSLLSRKRM